MQSAYDRPSSARLVRRMVFAHVLRSGRRRAIDMRSLLRDEPVSRLARWSQRSALFAAALAVIAVLVIRVHAVEVPAAVAVLAFALVFAIAAVPIAFAALVVIWRTGRRGVTVALAACLVSALVVAYPLYLLGRALTLPFVNDVTTDPAEPPVFSRAQSAFTGRDGHLPGHGRRPSADEQARSFADIHPALVDMETYDAYQLVLRIAASLRWTIVASVPPGGREGIGHVDAVDHTLVMGLPDDVAIRIRPAGDGSRIDMRSASRFGPVDFGTNAARIRTFAAALEDQIGPR